MVKVETKDILWAEAYDKYAYLQTAQQKYLLTSTLKDVEEKLAGLGFVRVHRSYLVNVSKLTAISEDFAFIDEHKLPLGRLYRNALLGGIARL
jgi:two-component system, LytTR family, response regulator LytT